MRRIARIAIAAAFAVAAAQAIRWLLERDGETAAALPRPRATPGPAAGRNGTAPSGGSAAEGPTRDQLYSEAKRLEIEGRSKMNKQELQQAVAAAKTGGSA
jgi:hypothetical protein